MFLGEIKTKNLLGFLPVSSNACITMELFEGVRCVQKPLHKLTEPISLTDDTNPLGPCLVSSNVIKDPQTLPLKCILNGETVQDGTTA